MPFQRTLKKPVSIHGVGLHSGKPVSLQLLPARPNRGVFFIRTDLPGRPEVNASYKNVINTQLATTLGTDGGVSVATVEHLLAALQGMHIDNVAIEVDGPEVPILDGSSLPFVKAIEEAGIATQIQKNSLLVLKRKVELKINEKWAVAEPCDRLEILATIEFDHPSIGFQEFKYIEGETSFAQLAYARTFGLLKDVERLKAMGLARGGSLENAVVLDDARVLNPEGLRAPDEFARHKVLDAMGDFKLAGLPIVGRFRLHRAGHDVHSQLIAAILSDSRNFEIREGVERADPRAILQPRLVSALASGY